MKKLFAISILFILITAAAFAQFKVSATVEFQGDILRTAAPIDNARDTSKTDPFSAAGTSGYEKRYVNFLSSYDYWVGSGMNLTFTYTDPDNKDDPKYKGLVQIDAGGLLHDLIANSKGSSADNLHYNFAQLFFSTFGDWYAWGKVGILKGYIGNTDNRGATADFRGAHYNPYMDRFKFASWYNETGNYHRS